MRWAAIGAGLVLAFDVVTALLAGPLGFEYGAWPVPLVSSAIYGVPAGIAAWETGRLRTGAAVGGNIALVDATAGWAATWLIGPAAPVTWSPASVAATVAIVAALSAGTGLCAGLVAVGLWRITGRSGRCDVT